MYSIVIIYTAITMFGVWAALTVYYKDNSKWYMYHITGARS
jgi:hypothetical protein